MPRHIIPFRSPGPVDRDASRTVTAILAAPSYEDMQDARLAERVARYGPSWARCVDALCEAEATLG